MEKKLATVYTLIAASLWGTIGLFVNILTSYGLTSIQLTVMRFMISTVIIGVYIGLKDKKKYVIQWKDLKWFFVTGVLCVLFFNVSYAIAIKQSSMSVAAVLLYTSPIIVTLISISVFGEILTKRKCMAVIFSVLGCALVSANTSKGSTSVSVEAFLWGMGAATGYAMYSVLTRVLLKKYTSITILFYTFVFASVVGGSSCRIDQLLPIFINNTDACLIVLISALLCNAIPYFLYSNALSMMEASNVSIIASIEPIVATLVGALVFKENITIYSVIGILSVLCSIIILNKSNKNGEM
ncbi:putative inner membrane transporter YicL [Clostridium puniceum]|uniref:Putative inner membrane transporter YicL n=1 Tax=Clostridium puniceum TaxID=29367 RepID=A0A1S8T7U6_9CLOT|nr:EamA family transporter [Clostridium puniceum]OOM73699.1 putative inner membrane transporter YicL [Clostridium puniceum]